MNWLPFELHPEYPPEGIPHADLERRFGPSIVARRQAMFDEAGLAHVTRPTKIPNSRRALMLAELARDRGLLAPLHPRLFEAVWARDLDIGDLDVLVDEGTAVGLDGAEIRNAIGDERYSERIESATQAALDLGAGGVPAWLIDERALIPGAQPHDVFESILGRLGHTAIE